MTRKYQTTADVQAAAARGEYGPRDTLSGWRKWALITACIIVGLIALLSWVAVL